MSDTPRTLAARRHESDVDASWLHRCQFVVPARVAAELEQELAAATAQIATLKQQLAAESPDAPMV